MKNAQSTKETLLDDLHSRGFSRIDCRLVLDSMLEVIVDIMSESTPDDENHLEIRGFGRFYTKMRKPRKGYDMHKRLVIHVPEHRVMLWRPTISLRKRFQDAYNEQHGVKNGTH